METRMNFRRVPAASLSGMFLAAVLVSIASAQSNPTYIPFGPGAVKGALYKPDAGPSPHVGIVIMHRTGNSMGHIAARELSKRGFLVLGMNARFENNEAAVHWEDIALDVKSGVGFLKKQPGITKVILLGHSGGGPTMSFYQAVAENGPSYCQGANKLVECTNSVAGLPRADGVVLLDSNSGNAVNTLRDINPAILNESDPRQIDPSIDPFRVENGFRADGAVYTEQFRKRYFRAQAERMNRLIAAALDEQRRMKEGKGIYRDDDLFLIPRGAGADLTDLDVSFRHATVKPQKLLRNDGSIVTQIVESVRRTEAASAEPNSSFTNGARLLTLRSFLSANAIRSTDSLDTVDWCSSNTSTPCALRSISVPILIAAMGAHFLIRDNEIHYEMAASKDKDFIVVEGANHTITPCVPCEKSPGQYSNTVKNLFDYVQKWIGDRY